MTTPCTEQSSVDERGALNLVLHSAGDGDAIEQLTQLWERMREETSRERMRARGHEQGFRLEDASSVQLLVPRGWAAEPLVAWLKRRLTANTLLSAEHVDSSLTLRATFEARVGFAPGRQRYARDEQGRVRLEAFELHVVEHCNLRCANCCNMSPLVGKHVLSVADVESHCASLQGAIHADVLKIMGGEPLLHPDIAGVIWALRKSGIGERVRLFTNGLLLHTMKDAFWEALEDLTISNYASAPVKPAALELAKERSRRHGFVLNVKPVSEFSQVLSPRYERNDEQTAKTFSRCWLRHRCLIVRGGRFFMCTRAAYAGDFLRNVAHEAPPTPLDRSGDGIPIDGHGLAERLEAYLNREVPLGACRYCFGGDGGVEAHYQLSREDVARGVLSRALAPRSEE